MNNRKIGNTLAVIALIFFVVAIIGNAVSGSHRWVETFEEAGWIFFVATILVLYLETDRVPAEEKPEYAKWVPVAWTFGVIAIALFLFALVANLAMSVQKSWVEAVELAGVVAMLVTIVSAIMSRGGWRKSAKEMSD
jgi:peptidoglycan/LPS O-acetylase OafA/YrhL